MPHEIKIPPAGESVASAQIAKWHFAEGAYVTKGAVLATLETDKVAVEVIADASGALHITKHVGEDVPVGEVIGSIDESVAPPASAAPAAPAPKPAEKAEPAPASEKPADKPAAAPVSQPAPKPAPAAAKPADNKARETRQRMTPLRRKIADHLVSAQQTAAILTTFNECDMSGVMALRSQLQDAFVAKHGVKLGFMSFFVKAVVDALKAVPQLNVRVEGDEIVTQHYYDVGVAVGTERGLVVPVLRDCDTKSFAQIEKDIAAYAARAKDGSLQIADLTGGVFTISNGGIYGSMLSTPILNPPQSAILGMHTIQQRPVAVNGEVVIRPMMYLALSYDHRVVDGREAVGFLVRVKDCIENPARILVGV